MTSSDAVTALLQRLAKGDTTAEQELANRVYTELRKLASSYLRRERLGHPLQTTELVSEAYIRLTGNQPNVNWQSRAHFFAIAAQTMRRILTDIGRRSRAIKRGGGNFPICLNDDLKIGSDRNELLADLDDALKRLETIDERLAKVVELRFFGGLTEEEIGGLLGISSRTVKRLWVTARAWLLSKLSPTAG